MIHIRWRAEFKHLKGVISNMMINGHGFGPDYLIDAGVTLIILIPLFFYILIRQFFNGHVTIVKVSGLIAFFLYVYALLSVTFFPIMVFKWGAKAYQYGFGKQYLANFNVLELFQYAPSQIIGNLALLLPLSILVAYLWPNQFSQARPNIILGGLTTLGIETLQLLMSFFYLGNRTFDVNDLILNIVGYLIGFGLYKISKSIFKLSPDVFQIL